MGVSGKLETRWWRTSWWEKVTVEGGAKEKESNRWIGS